MSDNAQRLVNYYISNPPFEISEEIQPTYIDSLAHVLEMSLIEFSENFPIISEKTVTTDSETTSLHIYNDIDTNFMNFILFMESTSIANFLFKYGIYYNHALQEQGMQSNISILNMVGISDKMHIIDEWASTKKDYIVFDDTNIKVSADSTYYVLYNRYRTESEIPKIHQRNFKKLFDINLLLAAYGSSLFSSEGGIKSVSLSGLSVSFNVPDVQTYQETLQKEKTAVLESMIDYMDCVESY